MCCEKLQWRSSHPRKKRGDNRCISEHPSARQKKPTVRVESKSHVGSGEVPELQRSHIGTEIPLSSSSTCGITQRIDSASIPEVLDLNDHQATRPRNAGHLTYH